MSVRAFFLRSYFWTNDFFQGQPIRKHFKEIAFVIERKRGFEQKREDDLYRLLQHAVKNTIFYSNYNSRDLQSFPVTSKIILRENYNDIAVVKGNIPGQEGEVFIQKTSGSTGTPFSVPQDTNKRQRRLAELKYFGKESGFNSHEKLVHLRTWNQWQAKTKKQIFWENIIPFGISKMGDENLQELTRVINEYKVATVRGYASSIDQLVKFAHANNISLPTVKLMIAGSEALQESTRELALSLGCNIISQYANEENGILGQELPHKPVGVFYLNDASYYFEVLKLDDDKPAGKGELGRVVVTDLFNYAFPMIRYDTGDVGVLDHKDGRIVLAQLYGRRLDLIYDISGNVVSPMSFSRIFKHFDFIEQWQFIQVAELSYELKLTNKIGIEKGEEKQLLKHLTDILGESAEVKITLVDDIPLLDSRKRKSVVNLWKQ